MAWTYSDWVTLSGTTRLSRLQLHIQEVSNKLTENYSIAGRSKQVDPLQKYLETLQARESQLGGNAPRANGGSRVNRVNFKNPDEGPS